jgi:hypothetical protein
MPVDKVHLFMDGIFLYLSKKYTDPDPTKTILNINLHVAMFHLDSIEGVKK